jgi:thioredoxin-dependent peroxiredoxin
MPNTLGIFPGRVTYAVDEEGVVSESISSQLDASKNVEEALKPLRSIGLEDGTYADV